MTKKKPSANGASVQVADYAWSDDYSPAFEPNNTNLYTAHKVPTFKRRFASD